jgi:signal peptidase I
VSSVDEETEPVSAAAERTEARDVAAPDSAVKKQGGGGRSFFRELPVLVVVALVLALLIKSFLVQAFYIPSPSMNPTLANGDRVLVNKLVYRFHEPRRGDVIVFSDPHPVAEAHRNPVQSAWQWLTQGMGISTDPNKDFIKRVIGLPGDTVEIHFGTVYINGQPIKEPYLSPVKETRDYGPVKVPANSLFVLGDNRTDSGDSRFGLGFIPMNKVIGRAFVIVWPPSRMRWLSGIHYS